jgi:hypothetical protein
MLLGQLSILPGETQHAGEREDSAARTVVSNWKMIAAKASCRRGIRGEMGYTDLDTLSSPWGSSEVGSRARNNHLRMFRREEVPKPSK